MAKKQRQAPEEHASFYKVGVITTGLDGNLWQVVINKNSVKRWQKVKAELKTTKGINKSKAYYATLGGKKYNLNSLKMDVFYKLSRKNYDIVLELENHIPILLKSKLYDTLKRVIFLLDGSVNDKTAWVIEPYLQKAPKTFLNWLYNNSGIYDIELMEVPGWDFHNGRMSYRN